MNDFLNAITSRLIGALDPTAVGDQLANLIEKLIIAGATFCAFYLLWHGINLLLKKILKRSNVDETAARFMLTIVKVVLLTVGLINALAAVGVDTASVLTSLGIAGITIGFAARDGLSNIISGIFIFWDRPFVIGDLIEIDEHYGRVDDITLRSTRVITPNGKMLSVPNSQMINSTVASYTNFPHLRIDVEVTVGNSENLEKVRRLLLEIIDADEHYMTDPAPAVQVAELGDYNIKLILEAWLKDERTHVIERFKLREAILAKLTAAGVDMPYETINIMPLKI